MKKFSQIISEVAEPKSGDEQRFKAAHVITKVGHPVALDHQFTGEVEGIGTSDRIADRKKGEDEAAYDPSYMEKNKQFKMPRNVDEAMDPVNKDELKGKHKDRKDQDIDNDGDVDDSDEYLHKRRKAVSKAISKAMKQESIEEALSATCGCGSDCGHCGGEHDMDEVGNKCSCCGNMIEPSAANESAELDEILDTPKAMQSYKNKAKASYDRAASSAAAKILRGKDKDGNRADHRPELRTMAKRKKGLTGADMVAVRRTFANLRNEEAELDEDRRTQLHHQSMMFTHAMKQAELKKKDPRLAKQHDMAGKLHAKAADLHIDNHPDAKKHSDKANRASKLLGEEVEQVDEISRSMTPMKNRFGGSVDPKKFDTYKKHMKTHKLDEPTVRMIHQNPNDAESKRMMKNPKYAQAVSLYKNSMKESVELSENPMEEKPMMMNALRSMSHNIMGIARYVQSTQDPEEWFQNKLAGVAKEMQTLYSYATAEVMAMGEEVELDESKKAALAKELSKASAASEKGKKAVTLKKAPWDEQVDETTLSAIKKPVNMTGPDGKTRTVYKTVKTKKYDDKGQDKIATNEETSQIDEAFKPGIVKFKNGQSMILKKEDSDILNKMLKNLSVTNRSKMEAIAMKDKKGFAEILGFAKEAL